MDQDPGNARHAPMVRSSLVEAAKSQRIDIVQAAKAGIARAVSRAADREAWRRGNLPAIQNYNRHVAEHGLELDHLRQV